MRITVLGDSTGFFLWKNLKEFPKRKILSDANILHRVLYIGILNLGINVYMYRIHSTATHISIKNRFVSTRSSCNISCLMHMVCIVYSCTYSLVALEFPWTCSLITEWEVVQWCRNISHVYCFPSVWKPWFFCKTLFP